MAPYPYPYINNIFDRAYQVAFPERRYMLDDPYGVATYSRDIIHDPSMSQTRVVNRVDFTEYYDKLLSHSYKSILRMPQHVSSGPRTVAEREEDFRLRRLRLEEQIENERKYCDRLRMLELEDERRYYDDKIRMLDLEDERQSYSEKMRKRELEEKRNYYSDKIKRINLTLEKERLGGSGWKGTDDRGPANLGKRPPL